MYVMVPLSHAESKFSFRLVPFTGEVRKFLTGISHSGASIRRNTWDFPRNGRKLVNVIAQERTLKNVINDGRTKQNCRFLRVSHPDLHIGSTVTLNNGIEMPRFGLGVYKSSPGTETKQAVRWAIQSGYCMIDTASKYANEHDVGVVIGEANLPRSSIFVVTKVWDDMHGYDDTILSLRNSLKKLSLTYVDLFLIHSPIGGKIVDTWRAMIQLMEEGYTRSIGVSNFGIHHLAALSKYSNVPPAVNQIELHPFNQERAVACYCRENDIKLMAYSPLTRGLKLEHPVLVAIARKHRKTCANVLVRWSLQKDMICIPKSVKEVHIKENRHVFDFHLDEVDMKQLDLLEENFRTGQDRLNEEWKP